MNTNSLIEDLIGNGRVKANMSRKERDRELRKADIMSAAERVFALKGYHDATIQDIAREAEYATGTVYLYFKDKEALYFSLLEEKMRNLTAVLKDKTAHVADAEDKLRIFIRESLNHFEKNQDFFRIFFSERTKGQILKEGKLARSATMQQNKELVIELIKSGQQQKIIRHDFSATQISDILGAIFMTVIFDWLKDSSKDKRKLDDAADFILDIFLSGAGRKK
ncbi:MAG: TetR/AcrR family transcriptional regulator [Candidatus Omnitrophica bacterium]|nr:TetR/AcrR family transcriptional regulator [Candidatus Omnitrophota bacterium]